MQSRSGLCGCFGGGGRDKRRMPVSVVRRHTMVFTASLLDIQAEYEAWRDGLPESLAESRTHELLEGVCDVDLDALDVELPRGFGRD